jgi:hypothetical protein
VLMTAAVVVLYHASTLRTRSYVLRSCLPAVHDSPWRYVCHARQDKTFLCLMGLTTALWDELLALVRWLPLCRWTRPCSPFFFGGACYFVSFKRACVVHAYLRAVHCASCASSCRSRTRPCHARAKACFDGGRCPRGLSALATQPSRRVTTVRHFLCRAGDSERHEEQGPGCAVCPVARI